MRLPAGTVRAGDYVRVLDKVRPNHFNSAGNMDYMLGGESLVKIDAVANSSRDGLIYALQTSEGWTLNLDECEVVVHVPKTIRRRGDV